MCEESGIQKDSTALMPHAGVGITFICILKHTAYQTCILQGPAALSRVVHVDVSTSGSAGKTCVHHHPLQFRADISLCPGAHDFALAGNLARHWLAGFITAPFKSPACLSSPIL